MQELERLDEDIAEDVLCVLARGLILAVEAVLRQLDEPVAVVVPDEVINFCGRDAELVDFEKELARIAKEKANAEKQLAGIESKLKNEGFLAKAPEVVVNGARADAEKLRALIEKLDASAAAMKK